MERRKKIPRIVASLLLLSIGIRVVTMTSPQPKGDIYAAIAHMEPLVEIEQRLADIARSYLNEQKKKLSELAPFAKSVEEALNLSENDPERYLGNPINCYLIIKRFTLGWKELPSRLDIDNKSLHDINELLKANEMYLPSEQQDVAGATAAIVRLQDSYGISAREISEGIIADLAPSMHQFTASDCMDIADVCHRNRRYVRMKEWLHEAERMINDPKMKHRYGNTTSILVHEFLAWASYLDNNLEEALRYTRLILAEDPTKATALENQKIYSWYINSNIPCTLPETDYMQAAREILEAGQKSTYVKVCKDRNPNVMGIIDINELRCYYKKDDPLLILKPVKVTVLHDNPYVLILHNVLSERYIDELKDIATPRLNVAEVIDPFTGERVQAGYRVSKSMFLDLRYVKDLAISRRLDPMFSAITGLDMSYSEELQMNNYGLGGQYEFHHDYGLPGSVIDTSIGGNRIATLLLYFTDVESGGETVFTELGLSSAPSKGDALFWYNLHRNGTGLFRTKHAGCPVVSGSKWVANKWIRMSGNEFRRPCTLNRFE